MAAMKEFFTNHPRKWLGLLVVLFIIYMITGKKTLVDVAIVERGTFREVITEDGKTRAKDVFEISSPVNGTLHRVILKPGYVVTKSQVVATVSPSASALLDSRAVKVQHAQLGSAQAALSEAEIMAERAKVAFATAVTEYQRKEKLSKKGFVSETELEKEKLQVELRKKEFEASKYNVRAAKHEVTRAEAALENIRQVGASDASKFDLHSPIDGHVIKVSRESAGSIAKGTVIMQIANLKELEIVVELLSQDAVKIPDNAKVQIRRWGGDMEIEGRVRLIEPGGFTKVSALGVEEQRVNVVIEITTPYNIWKSLGVGFRVDVGILIHEIENQVLVPVSALFRDGKSWAVYRVQDGVAIKQVIEITRYNTDFAIVKAGLEPQQHVIIYPPEDLHDGSKVEVRQD